MCHDSGWSLHLLSVPSVTLGPTCVSRRHMSQVHDTFLIKKTKQREGDLFKGALSVLYCFALSLNGTDYYHWSLMAAMRFENIVMIKSNAPTLLKSHICSGWKRLLEQERWEAGVSVGEVGENRRRGRHCEVECVITVILRNCTMQFVIPTLDFLYI